MRHVLASPDFRDGFVEMLPACAGLVPFGLVCGVGAAAAGAGGLFWNQKITGFQFCRTSLQYKTRKFDSEIMVEVLKQLYK